METKTYKLVDLFRDFYILFVNQSTDRLLVESNLSVLVRLLSAQLMIVNSDKAPENIPAPIRDFFPRFLEMLNYNRDAVRYVCERVIQLQEDKTQVDREDKLLLSYFRRIMNQLSSDEAVEMEEVEIHSMLSIKKKISCEITIPSTLEERFLAFCVNRLKEWGCCLSGFSSVGLSQSKITIEAIQDGEEDKLFSLLEKFSFWCGLLVEPHADGKLTFGELGVGDKFIAFPTPGDNSGHGGFLGTRWIFRKIKKMNGKCENAVRCRFSSSSSFDENSKVIRIE